MRYPTDSPLLRLQRVYSRSYYLQKSGVADPTIVGAFCELDTELRARQTPKPKTVERLERLISVWTKCDNWEERLCALLVRLERFEGARDAFTPRDAFTRLVKLGANPDVIAELLSDLLAALTKPNQRIDRRKLVRAGSHRLKDAANLYLRLEHDAEARQDILEAFEGLHWALERVLLDYEPDAVNPEMDCVDALQDHLIETTSTYADVEVIDLLNPILEKFQRPSLEVNVLSMRRKRLRRFRRRPATTISYILLPRRRGLIFGPPPERLRRHTGR
jgi:hypothetical protein